MNVYDLYVFRRLPARQGSRYFRHNLGVTLLEVLMVMAISGVLAMIAAPSMSAIVNSARLSSASNTFVTGLHHARSEAIKRRSRVVLCKSGDGLTCLDSGGWEQGWIVFHDENNNGYREDPEHIIRHEGRMGGKLRLNQNVARYVSFTPTGTTRLVGGGFQAGTLTLCHQSESSSEARQIILNAIGRPRVDKAPVASCA